MYLPLYKVADTPFHIQGGGAICMANIVLKLGHRLWRWYSINPFSAGTDFKCLDTIGQKIGFLSSHTFYKNRVNNKCNEVSWVHVVWMISVVDFAS